MTAWLWHNSKIETNMSFNLFLNAGFIDLLSICKKMSQLLTHNFVTLILNSKPIQMPSKNIAILVNKGGCFYLLWKARPI